MVKIIQKYKENPQFLSSYEKERSFDIFWFIMKPGFSWNKVCLVLK